MLEREGCQVTTVCDGGEAVLEATRGSKQYQLVLMDLQMPTLDGFQATAKIRQEEQRHHRTPSFIVAVSLHELDTPCPRCLAVGMNAFLNKPVLVENLKRVLNEVVAAGAKNGSVGAVSTDSTARGFPPIFRSESEPDQETNFRRVQTEGPLIFDRDKAMRMFRSQALMAETMQDFFVHARSKLSQLVLAAESNDSNAIRETVHWFRGGATFLFSPLVLAACIELTRLSRLKPTPALNDATDNLRWALDQLEQHLPSCL